MSGDTTQGGTQEQLVAGLIRALTELQTASDQVDQAAGTALGLNRTDARCLSCLITHGPMAAGDLAAAAGIAATALTFVIDRLTRAGYAQRRRDPADRRRVLITASDEARRLAEQMWSQTIADTRHQLSKYTPQQLELLTDFITDQVRLQRRQAQRITEDT
ncbi:MarR family transcriptional regulator [Sphaerisporangium krabiense]|uniref:DNA-binding MarR family transcriptional regulator n=1 Tax=Sphaerisporangium krabiense TaxID=763782 RepID=A0A7W8Z1Y7_9ACTN|nr:MarR family transcriptional regulator [Sphaerisporangium krabiense]MBB5625895.1 DNA-binding MarR family transcriptional regulator [Sphaerisporangium krabiense]GII64697.1 MarR family transcriptional regulator [Sphaerisporangium krabiense]